MIASVSREQMFLPTPCDLWDVKDVINKLVASTRLFTGFGLRQPPDHSLDLINPKHDHFSNHNYSVNGEVGFPPLRLIKAGDYTVWVQVKTENKIITQKFNFTISS